MPTRTLPLSILLTAVSLLAVACGRPGRKEADLSGVDTLGEDTTGEHPAPISGALPSDSLGPLPEDTAGPRPEHRSADQGEAVETTPTTADGELPSWTSQGITQGSTASAPPTEIADVRTARHPDFDRVVFDVEGQGSGVPGYRIGYVDTPLHLCGSGAPVYPSGQGWLEVRLQPAQAHGASVRPSAKRDSLAVGLPQVGTIYRTCDFEGIATWVLAVKSPQPFRTFTLKEPRRVVVDVRH